MSQGCRVQTHLDHVDAVTLQGAIDRIDLVACDVPGWSRHDGGRAAAGSVPVRLALLAAAAVLGIASALAGAGVLSGTSGEACPPPTPRPSAGAHPTQPPGGGS